MAAEKMNLGDRHPDAWRVVAVNLGDGCKENCVQCGAYPPNPDREATIRALTVREVTAKRIEACLTRDVEGSKPVEGAPEVPDQAVSAVRQRLVDFFANYVTTGVNQEPLNGDAFVHFAEIVKRLSGGKSRVVCVSHGLRVSKEGKPVDEAADARLQKIVSMMDEQDVFVLSLDLARSQGKISKEVNLASYVETLDRLRPALAKGSRVTISIQGDDDKDSPLYRGLAYDFCQEVINKLGTERGWGREEIMALYRDSGRAWVQTGRSKQLPGVGPDGECAVVPDISFVSNTLDMKHGLMAVVDAVSGKVFVHDHNAKKTYKDVARLNRALADERAGLRPKWYAWEEASVNGNPLPDLTEEVERPLNELLVRLEYREVEELPEGAIDVDLDGVVPPKDGDDVA